MKVKLMIICIFTLVGMFGFASTAYAQSVCGIASVTPLSGIAGGTATASGGLSGGDVTVLWDGVAIATIPNDGMTGEFSGVFTVPATAALGAHTVTLSIPSEGTSECPFTFTVVESVQADAYPTAALPASLPSTGLILIVPVAGLAVAGMGGIVLRKRRNG